MRPAAALVLEALCFRFCSGFPERAPVEVQVGTLADQGYLSVLAPARRTSRHPTGEVAARIAEHGAAASAKTGGVKFGARRAEHVRYAHQVIAETEVERERRRYFQSSLTKKLNSFWCQSRILPNVFCGLSW
jgi:hypothetical protein